jgi:hypothetical protein
LVKISLLPQFYLDINVSLDVVLTDIGDIIAYRDGLHFCQEVYPYRNQN